MNGVSVTGWEREGERGPGRESEPEQASLFLWNRPGAFSKNQPTPKLLWILDGSTPLVRLTDFFG